MWQISAQWLGWLSKVYSYCTNTLPYYTNDTQNHWKSFISNGDVPGRLFKVPKNQVFRSGRQKIPVKPPVNTLISAVDFRKVFQRSLYNISLNHKPLDKKSCDLQWLIALLEFLRILKIFDRFWMIWWMKSWVKF